MNWSAARFLVFILIFSIPKNGYSQHYEVYEDKEGMVSLVRKDAIIQNIQLYANDVTKKLEVIDTKIWNGQGSNKNCLYTFFLIDEKINPYQLQYFSDGYVILYKANAEEQPIGAGRKLLLKKIKQP